MKQNHTVRGMTSENPDLLGSLTGLITSLIIAMNRIDPIHGFRLLDRVDVCDVYDDCLVVGSDKYAFQDIIRIGVDFLVWHIWRNENKVARPRLGDKFEPVSPSHPRFASDDENNAFQSTVVMDACFRVGLNRNCASPDFLGADAGVIDCCLSEHTRRLRCIWIELIPFDDPYTVVFPTRLFGDRVGMRVR